MFFRLKRKRHRAPPTMSIRWLFLLAVTMLITLFHRQTEASSDLHEPKNTWYVEDGKEYRCLMGREASREGERPAPKEIDADRGVPSYNRWG
uniref:Uncharacterized protein n=1 Tax=Steinernema glaseri TaxID=37863 RepID=A0A1I8AS18_9BILA